MTSDEIKAVMATRDMRYYGLRPWDNRDAGQLCALVNQGRYDEDGAQSEALIALTWDMLDESTRGEIIQKLRRCPPRRIA
jgi:hypothetical protein